MHTLAAVPLEDEQTAPNAPSLLSHVVQLRERLQQAEAAAAAAQAHAAKLEALLVELESDCARGVLKLEAVRSSPRALDLAQALLSSAAMACRAALTLTQESER